MACYVARWSSWRLCAEHGKVGLVMSLTEVHLLRLVRRFLGEGFHSSLVKGIVCDWCAGSLAKGSGGW